MRGVFTKRNWQACWPRESSSWEELRLWVSFRRNCEKDRRADAEKDSSAALKAACASVSAYIVARILI